MKISVAKEPLLHVVTAIGGIVPARSTMPILYNILLEAEEGHDGCLKLAGTDLDISLSYRMKATIERPGAITIPAKKFGEIVRVLPNSPINIEQTGDRIKIVCEKSSIVLPGLPKSDFPAFPEKSFDEALKISNAVMRKLVLHSSYSAGKEEDRQILKGVLWEIGKDEMSMVSTNGHRLAKMTVKESLGLKDSLSVVVPPKAAALLSKSGGVCCPVVNVAHATWAWGSMPPGITILPVASITRWTSPIKVLGLCTATIFPPCIPMS